MRTQLALVAALVSLVAVVLLLPRALATSLTVAVDGDGWFSGTGVAGTLPVHAGDGVSLAVLDPATGAVAGRLDPKAPAPFVWQRTVEGKLDARALRTVRSDVPRAAAVRALAVASLPEAGASSTTAAFLECCGRGTEAAPARQMDAPFPVTGGRAAAAAPGLPLAAWAPQECLFVRFRSVEAAYRFASAFDAVAGALLAAGRDDARDYGTLRLTLHDLLLPTIWRTNPEAQRGVGEVGLVVAAPFVRGRLSAAAVLRITDPELHRMQTIAGVAQQAAPDHLWRPADDPFPAERDPINFRVVPDGAPDVEIVATSRALGERIASRRFAALDADPRYRAAREEADAFASRPSASEAAFAFSSFDDAGLLRTAAREAREGLGLAWLARKWLGVARNPSAPDLRSRGAAPLASVRWLCVTTDLSGAHVTVSCDAESSAREALDALAQLGAAGPAADRACARNLADLVPLALVEKPDDIAERAFVVLGWRPVCPCGGSYSVHPVTREVSCTEHGTAAAPRAGRFVPPAISELAVRGASLSFRLAIDWNRRE